MMDPYTSWLKQSNQPLFEAVGTYWRVYQKTLVPASLKPEPVELSKEQAQELLEKSGALFVRYFTRTSEMPTAFWYTACSEYKNDKLPGKVRSQIRRAYKDCRVERVDAAWLSDNGYACYKAAYSRYTNAEPGSKEAFDQMCRGLAGGPFDFWGVFVGDKLVGFAKCVVGDDYAASVVIKMDPQFLSLSPASGLQDAMLTCYVAGQNKIMLNGFRSLVHDTNMHDFLLKFGYRRVYCDLKVVYRPSLQALVNLLYPFRSVVSRTPESGLTGKLRVLLAQEEIQRSFEPDGKAHDSIKSIESCAALHNHHGTLK